MKIFLKSVLILSAILLLQAVANMSFVNSEGIFTSVAVAQVPPDGSPDPTSGSTSSPSPTLLPALEPAPVTTSTTVAGTYYSPECYSSLPCPPAGSGSKYVGRCSDSLCKDPKKPFCCGYDRPKPK